MTMIMMTKKEEEEEEEEEEGGQNEECATEICCGRQSLNYSLSGPYKKTFCLIVRLCTDFGASPRNGRIMVFI